MRIAWIHIKIRLLVAGLFIMGIPVIFSCEDNIKKGSFIQSNDLNISSYLAEQDEYSMFSELLVVTDLFDALNSYNPYGNGFTVFAPTNGAIDSFIANSGKYSSFEDLKGDQEFINVLTRFHVVLSSYNSNDFPFGALNDSTITGDFLTIGFQISGSVSRYLVNNYSEVIDPNIQLSNGFVHGVNKVLEPIILSSYEWLKEKEGVSIFLELLEQTGWSDSMGIERVNKYGQIVRNRYSLFIEPDSVFQKRGIGSFEDLVEMFGTPGLPYDEAENGISRFAAYHLLEQVLFLDDIETGIYNTFTSLPVQISSGTEIRLNPGSRVIDSIISGVDTMVLDYVPIIYAISNNPTKNGPVHFISEWLELYKPVPGIITYHFKSEPVIEELKDANGRYSFEDPSEFEVLYWEGTRNMDYVVGDEAIDAYEDDFLELDGPFFFRFTTPRIFPGRYNFIVRAHSNDYDNAVIQIYIDGKRMGTNINLKSTNEKTDFVMFEIGSVDILDYSTHDITINTVIPGIMKLDMIRFEP